MNKDNGARRPAGSFWYGVAGGAAGLINGFFGGGGGMILVPLLTGKCGLDQRRAFATSVAVIAPLCALSAGQHIKAAHLGVHAVGHIKGRPRTAGQGKNGGKQNPGQNHAFLTCTFHATLSLLCPGI